MASELRVRGIVRNLQRTIESRRNYEREFLKKTGRMVVKGILSVLPDAVPELRPSPSPGQTPPKQKQVLTFVLEIKDAFPHNYPLLEVAMSGRKIVGIVREHDEVIVTGRLDRKTNRLLASNIESLRTGQNIYCSWF